MREELEEGDFDKDGYYHWKNKEVRTNGAACRRGSFFKRFHAFLFSRFVLYTQKDEVKDAWLDNIDWANINSFKKQQSQGGDTKAADEAADDDEEEEEEDVDSADDGREETNEDRTSQIVTFKKILELLRPGESVLKAINRLGKTGASTTSRAGLSASQRWLKKKSSEPASQQPHVDADKARADREAIEALTGFANFFIERGFYDIYDETYEKVKAKVDRAERKTAPADPLDIFADEVDESDLLAARTSTSAAESKIEGLLLEARGA